ncbi:MAG: sulfite reductase subunit alpha [Verrucomicrobia bacterium]|nr:sulfite reductase subunit alpha [Verrucomicrobiota bacterium]
MEVPYIPETAPFTSAQRAWLNGFLAGLFSSNSNLAAKPKTPVKLRTNVYFGSETGNAEALAKRISKLLRNRGFDSQAISLGKISSGALAGETHALIVTSTFGEGDPPENAKRFYNELHAPDHPRLPELGYSVLALGDTNYEQFCKCGKDIDFRLEELGARRIYQRADCNVDYEAPVAAWTNGILALLEAEPKMAGRGMLQPLEAAAAGSPTRPAIEAGYSRKNPFPAKLTANRLLTKAGSAKETRHLEISLTGSGLTYEAGDALGVAPSNCPELVDQILRVLSCDGEEAVPGSGDSQLPLRKALLEFYEITRIPHGLFEFVAEHSGDSALRDLLSLAAADRLKAYLSEREIVDLLVEHPSAKLRASEFVSYLKKLAPRLYSIASSPAAHSDSVHLTVSIVRYQTNGRKRKGVCSTFLADRVNGNIFTFVHKSPHFRLPADPSRPVIMVGPGTGIAPFRGFLYQREATQAKGPNWLFFGDQKESTDFLYRDELLSFREKGVLARLDTAFSRDQAEKVYVQHRMLQQANELWSWLENGAHFYVCGDARRMAKDVDAALKTVIQRAGQKSADDAEQYINQLKADHRYQRDVY